MKIQIHHLPSGTKWVGKDYSLDGDALARAHTLLMDASKCAGQTMNLETSDGGTHYFSANVIKECVLSMI